MTPLQRTAAIIHNGQSQIFTQYGRKTERGTADLIYRESGLFDLIQAAEKILRQPQDGHALAILARTLDEVKPG